MPTNHDAKKLAEQRLHSLLATMILVADGYRWPGTDGMLIEDILREYPRASREGRLPDRDELCRRHPELAQAVADFFDCFRSTI